MKEPISYRMQIPFFYKKSESEFQKDIYERYDDMVIRQTALHLADKVWGQYPLQDVIDFANPYLPESKDPKIVELGCSVGRWIATLAAHYPESICWGLDYSYQMLKRAHEFWKEKETIYLDLTHKGVPNILEIQGHELKNLHFGLAKAEVLPFVNKSQDLILSSFLLDRLENPREGLKEMLRVLKPKGKIILVTPLNFYKKKQWEMYHPPIKIYHLLLEMGFEILEWKDELILEEPLDIRGNVIKWNCVGVVGMKK